MARIAERWTVISLPSLRHWRTTSHLLRNTATTRSAATGKTIAIVTSSRTWPARAMFACVMRRACVRALGVTYASSAVHLTIFVAADRDAMPSGARSSAQPWRRNAGTPDLCMLDLCWTSAVVDN